MPVVSPSTTEILDGCRDLADSLYVRCAADAPNFGVSQESFEQSLARGIRKYLLTDENNPPQNAEVREFLNALQVQELFLSIGCASGNERAWWEFDRQYRGYLERIARHLASTDVNAEEVVDTVYVELYGTRIVDGVRMSKFASYTGRGSLRGWLRTIVWHALVDLHRASHDEVSLDEMTENVGESYAQSSFLQPSKGGENEMVEEVVRERYRAATVNALENSFAALENHEKLLLLYYHVEGLKLREIARLVEVPDSSLRDWFQRRATPRDNAPNTRVHESTVMRWLDKTYGKVLRSFKSELTSNSGLKETEIELCVGIATEDLVQGDITRRLKVTPA